MLLVADMDFRLVSIWRFKWASAKLVGLDPGLIGSDHIG